MSPPILAGGIGLKIAYSIYSANKAENAMRLPFMAPPNASQSILIFAPHCDDESLGAAGLMRQAENNRCQVHVVIMTNGDGFRFAAQRYFNDIKVGPDDMVRYGYIRQRETDTALAVLHVPEADIQFLGYPDRGLMPCLTTNWDPATPFKSVFTQADHNPYTDVLSPGKPYCGESVLNDVRTMMERIKPTDIYVTHPDDDHPDHAATSVFVLSALEQYRDAGEPWALKAHLHYYLVHRGDWPVPQGLDEDFPLGPPAPMASLNTTWCELKLSHRDIQRKYAALRRYPSQIMLTSRFMYSFVKKNELFGTLPDPIPSLPIVPNHTISLGTPIKSWSSVNPLILDPVGDSVLPTVQAGGDIQTVSICRDSHNLYILLHMHGQIDPKISYQVVLRPMSSKLDQSNSFILSVSPVALKQREQIPGHPRSALYAEGKDLQLSLPLNDASLAPLKGAKRLYLAANTFLPHVRIDKTGFRCIALSPTPQPAERVAAQPTPKAKQGAS
jgi:LmbE family N-acetylglucosaminyl deacetylase